jgi:hypothetical protein
MRILNTFDIVRVRTTPTTVARETAGLEGVVLGASEDGGVVVAYAVHLYDHDQVWMIRAEDLEPTGRRDRRENFYDGASTRVSFDGELLDGSR